MKTRANLTGLSLVARKEALKSTRTGASSEKGKGAGAISRRVLSRKPEDFQGLVATHGGKVIQ